MSEEVPSPRWPDHFPDGCPPTDAVTAGGSVYRAVAADPLVADDFLSHVEQGKTVRNAVRICQACGLSVQRTIDEARRHKERFPGLYRHIAVAALEPSHGATKLTPSRDWPRHETWWPQADVVREAIFRVIE